MGVDDERELSERVLDAALLRRSTVRRERGHGLVPCPNCRVDRAHTLVARYEVTGLLGSLLPPRGRLIAMSVECDACRRGFDRALLDRPLYRDR